jgi:hypothetical protein
MLELSGYARERIYVYTFVSNEQRVNLEREIDWILDTDESVCRMIAFGIGGFGVC